MHTYKYILQLIACKNILCSVYLAKDVVTLVWV